MINGLSVSHKDGEVQTVEAKGALLSLPRGEIGYTESASTAPASVEFDINGSILEAQMQSYTEYPEFEYARTDLPTSRPLRAKVEDQEWIIYRVSALPSGVDSSYEVEEGYDVILTIEAQTQVRSFAFQAANALNNGSAWSDIKAPRPPKAPVDLVEQDLVGFTKMKWAEADTVEAGDVLSHDNGTMRGLWKAKADTTAEPTKDSSDWTLVFEITV